MILDGLAGLVFALPGIIAMLTLPGDPDISPVGVALVILGSVALLIIQLVLLTTQGQTIGKKMMSIRIARYDDDGLPGFVKAVLLRGIVPGLMGSVPVIGGIFALVNILFIFRDDRRCIHDLIAGTHVVVA
jgi:uncharacterized RDD family membrane protein YckC